MEGGSLGSGHARLPEPMTVAAVEATPNGAGLAVTGGGAGNAVVELGSERGVVRRAGLAAAPRWQLMTKRAIDIVGSLLILLLTLPVLVLTAAAISLTSRGPLLYVHQRIGKGGRPFPMLKFRSMRVRAHEDREHVAHMNEAAGPVFKIKSDPRVTLVGRVIRKLSIDELPQLVNVLVGHMSLVGPRPPLLEEYETYGPRERRRLSVTPGITCIWQVSGRSDLDFDTWVDMDLEYIEGWRLRRDLKLLLLTIPAVVSGRGAY